MELIKELKNYCEIYNPVGALMISGEWGCGKTYLIKTKFIPLVKAEYVFVYVSLFGIDSLEKLRVEIKKKWLEKASEFDRPNGTKLSKVTDSYKRIFGTIKDVLPEDWQKKGDVISSVMDLVNFVPISNEMFEKKVILVFDDLERSNIFCTDLLGCINDYCENQNFNTIIIANEDKIGEGSDGKISYGQIKEKIVQRVIPFVPDYSEVVSDIIESISCGIEYKGLLKKNKELLTIILSGDFNDEAIIEQHMAEHYKHIDSEKRDEMKKEEARLRKLLAQRPHNIRSFKCAIQDFERVYNRLVGAEIQEYSNWLLSFTCLMMVNKAGLIRKIQSYGNIFLYNDVEILYPNIFKTNYILDGFSKWIIYGEWNDDAISNQIQVLLEKRKAVTPLQILRTHCLPEVEEEVISDGFKDLLIEVYAGKLSLDEYIRFLYNCYFIRKYELILPTINWEKVKDGIREQIKFLIKSDQKDSHNHRIIGEDSKKNFTEDEWSAYQIIKEFRENDVWIYEKNQKLYKKLISSDLNVAFRELSNKRYHIFSLEMESATIDAFKKASNCDKNYFSDWFVKLWGQYSNSSEIDSAVTGEALKKLRDDLSFVMREYKEKGKNIAAGHTQKFIDKLNVIIKLECEDMLVEK